MKKKPITKDMAIERLCSLCSRSEQCEFELTRKMVNWGITSSERKEVIDYLRENRFVDDARFANAFVKDKARFSGWGPAKIRVELTRRKINSSLISQALENVEPRIWKEALLRVASSKAKSLDLSGQEAWQERQKLFRFLIGRGFPSQSVSRVIAFLVKKQKQEDGETLD